MRVDAIEKLTGSATFTADVELPGACFVAFARGDVPRARLVAVRLDRALAAPGVLLAVTAADLPRLLWGRRIRDMPLLAGGEIRFAGERVAAVVAESRELAERAAALVDVEYEPLAAVTDPELSTVAQSFVERGSREDVDRALAAAAHVFAAEYRTQSVHQGYLEPPAAAAVARSDGRFEVWVANKAPYRLRGQLAETLGRDPGDFIVHPVALGGDFGGKGAPMDAATCILLAERLGRPVRYQARAGEDLVAGNPRHSARIRVRIGCDAEGRLVAAGADLLFDGGAYAAFKPRPQADLHGADAIFDGYRMPVAHVASRIVSTNTVPRGHMRAPGSPQANFAFESALDELAELAGVDPVELRRRNLLRSGEPDAWDRVAVEERGVEVLEAALAAFAPLPVASGERSGTGLACYRRMAVAGRTSLRLLPLEDRRVRAEVAMPETGVGVHTAVRIGLARLLNLDAEAIEVVQVATSELPHDDGVGASRVTAGLSFALEQAARAFDAVDRAEAVTVDSQPAEVPEVACWAVQVAQVAVDPETGRYRVLQVVTAVDSGEVLNPLAHRAQVEGGAAMGFGFACLEDLQVAEGRVWAGHPSEFHIASARDVPAWRTVNVEGGHGVGALDVKPVGEVGNVAVVAAVANALAAAGARVRALPITAERVLEAIR